MKSVQLLQSSRSYEWTFRGDIKHANNNNLRFFGCKYQGRHKYRSRIALRRWPIRMYKWRAKGEKAFRCAFWCFFQVAIFASSRLICWFYRLNMKRTELFRFFFLLFWDEENPAAWFHHKTIQWNWQRTVNRSDLPTYLNGLFEMVLLLLTMLRQIAPQSIRPREKLGSTQQQRC